VCAVGGVTAVTFFDRVTVQNCVVGHHVIIEEGATLKDCYIGSHVVIPKAGTFSGRSECVLSEGVCVVVG
jgi:ADP-glucose pyrophosphorylase